MPESCTHVYVHYVWATWDRMPLITAERETAIYACTAHKCRELRCDMLAIGGTADHVHSLVRLYATVSIAVLAQGMKGASSYLVNHSLDPTAFFRWQGSYGAFSVSLNDLDQVNSYIRRQKEHHASGDLRPDWERCMEVTDRGNQPPDCPPPEPRR